MDNQWKSMAFKMEFGPFEFQSKGNFEKHLLYGQLGLSHRNSSWKSVLRTSQQGRS